MLTRIRSAMAQSPYLVSFVLTLLLGFVSLPTVVGNLGASAWTSIALGQAIGSFAAVVCGYGYDVFGPTAVARTDIAQRAQLYSDSFAVRLLCGIIALAVAVPVALAVGGSNRDATAVIAAGSVLGGLGAGWVFIGSHRPKHYFVCDATPKLLATLIGLIVVSSGGSAVLYSSLQLAGFATSVLTGRIGVRRLYRSPVSLRHSVSAIPQNLRQQFGGFAVGGAAALYVAAPVVIVSTFAANGLTPYALVDKLSRFTTAGLNVFVQIYQGWVPAAPHYEEFRRRAIAALRFNLAMGVAVAAAFPPAAYFLAPPLSGNKIRVGWDLSIPLGIALGLITVSQCMGLVILPAVGRRTVVVASTVAAAAVGLPTAIIATHYFGARGAACSVAAVETVVVLVQAAFVRGALTRGAAGYRTSADTAAANERPPPVPATPPREMFALDYAGRHRAAAAPPPDYRGRHRRDE